MRSILEVGPEQLHQYYKQNALTSNSQK